jgi:hypothetical protein
MKFLNNKAALNLCNVVLFFAGLMDIVRGYTHTFRVRYATANLAKAEVTTDNLVLMSAFGISNFLSAFLYFLIIWKAKKLAPLVLVIIPISYLVGGLGMQYSDVILDPDKFKGQYIMPVYLSICMIVALLYFVVTLIDKKRNNTF